MVRARRVRAVVGACARNDECCSPHPKRKDQGAVKGKLAQNVNKITHFFNTVPSSDTPLDGDLDDVGKEEFKVLPDVDGDLEPATRTPHRIQLRDDAAESASQRDGDVKENDGRARMPTAGANAQRCSHDPPVAHLCRRLNTNQSFNQPPPDGATAKTRPLTEYFPVRRSVRKTKQTVLAEKQRTLEAHLQRAAEDGLHVHHFAAKGRGVVATRRFARGDFVVEYAGDLIGMPEARRRELRYAQDKNAGCYMYYFKHRNAQYCIDATAETGRLGRLVNHARNGNLRTRVIDVGNQPRLVLVAKATIQAGDEVCYDYGDRSKESLQHHPWLAN